MNWIYYINVQKNATNSYPPMIQVYLRPLETDINGNQLVGKLIHLSLCAIAFYFRGNHSEIQLNEGFNDIYHKHLSHKEQHIQEFDIPETFDEFLLEWAIMYIKQESITRHDILKWLRVFFAIKGYAVDELVEEDYEAFADCDPMQHINNLKACTSIDQTKNKEQTNALKNKLLKNISTN